MYEPDRAQFSASEVDAVATHLEEFYGHPAPSAAIPLIDMFGLRPTDKQHLDRQLIVLLVALCVIMATAVRISLGSGLPLWLDETWTAVIASQPDWTSFWHEAWLDCNAPLYYLLERGWISIAGNSNAAMRLPSGILLYAAAALPLLWTSHGLNRMATIIWAGLIVLWWPGSMISVDARGYGLLLFLSVSALLAFMGAYRTANARSFALWSTFCALQLLTHYFASFLVAAQGLALLWKWRLVLVQRSYAFAPLLAPVGWALYHLPRLRDYSRPDVVWYVPTNLARAIGYASYTFGPPTPYFALLITIAIGCALWKSNWKLNALERVLADENRSTAVQAAVWTVALALGAVLMASAFMPSLTERYLVPLAPSMLLAIVLLASRVPRTNLAHLLLVAIYMIYAIAPAPLAAELKSRSFYGYEQASDFVGQSHPTDLVFVWDHPAAKILSPRSLEQIGAFFLHRQGIPVRTKALILTQHDNPNVAIRSAVANERTGILWLYDASHRSVAAKFPPTLAKDPAWKCLDRRSYRLGEHDKKFLKVGVIACVPRSLGKPK